MNCRHCSIFFLLFVVTTITAMAQAPMFRWSSSRSMALGGIGTTGFDEPSAMHLNPASLVDIERFSLNAGIGSEILNGTVNTDKTTVDSDKNFTIMPSVTDAINFGSRLVGAGISLNSFDSYHISYPSSAENRYQGTEMSLYSGGFDAAIGFMPIKNWAFGFKIGYMAAHAEWIRNVNPFPDDPNNNLDMKWRLDMDSTSDWNALAGAIWSPSYRFEAGLTYRPPLAYHFDPDISLELPELMGGVTIRSGAKELRMEVPQEIRLGFHWLASERIDLYLDAGWINYASLETLEITAKDPKPQYIDKTFQIPIDMDDVWHGHAGIEVLASSFLTLRTGGYYYSDGGNESYENTLLPQGEHYGITAGFGLHLFEWDVDVACGKTFYNKRRISGSELPFPLSAETEYDLSFGAVSVKYRF